MLALLAGRSRRSGIKSRAVQVVVTLACAGLVGVQGAFLVFAGADINSYAPTSYPVTPTVATLQRLVGHHLVGFDVGSDTCADAVAGQACGVRSWAGIGFYPDINLGYGIAELGLHDPLIPKAYFNSWPIANAGQEGVGANVFAPSIDTVALAQRYGVQYVLIQPPQPVPAGMLLVSTLEDPAGVPVKLAYVPDSGQFSFAQAVPVSWASPAAAVVSVSHPNDVTYRLRVRTAAPSRLIIRITDTPGWHASADGHPLALARTDGALLSTIVPGGTTEVVLTYQPGLLDVGWLLAVAALVVLVGAFVVSVLIRAKRARHS